MPNNTTSPGWSDARASVQIAAVGGVSSQQAGQYGDRYNSIDPEARPEKRKGCRRRLGSNLAANANLLRPEEFTAKQTVATAQDNSANWSGRPELSGKDSV